METSTSSDPTGQDARALLDADRTAAEQALSSAQDHPALSREQSCAVAQVHALLAIEQRLRELAASIDAVLVMLANRSDVADGAVATPA
ncbi:MAG: hypothetical protein WD271_03020 [Acidimicrobiia bacterium]